MDISKMCECVAGGFCRTRGLDIVHHVTLLWADEDGLRLADTLASAAQLDAWMGGGDIVGAHCRTCHEDVATCPVLRPYLCASGWGMGHDGRAAIRLLIAELRLHASARLWLGSSVAGLRYILSAHRPVHADDSQQQQPGVGFDIDIASRFHGLWADDLVVLADVAYWLVVLDRFRRLSPGNTDGATGSMPA